MNECDSDDEFDDISMDTSVAVSFVKPNEADEYKCGICLDMVQDAVAVCESHFFCKTCIESYIQQKSINSMVGTVVECPSCRERVGRSHVKRVKFVDRIVRNLDIKCPNHEITAIRAIYLEKKMKRSSSVTHVMRDDDIDYDEEEEDEDDDGDDDDGEHKRVDADIAGGGSGSGGVGVVGLCSWTGKLEKLSEHIQACKYEIIRCVRCKHCIERGHKRMHDEECEMFPVTCDLCKDFIPRNFLEDHINTRCMYTTVQCPSCRCEIKRLDLEHHLMQCPEAVMNCAYHEFGCTHMPVKRRNMSRHMKESTTQHLALLLPEYRHLKMANEKLERTVISLQQSHTQLFVQYRRLEALVMHQNQMRQSQWM